LKPGRGLAGVLAVLDRSGQETDVAVAAAPARTAPGWASDSRPPVWRLLGLAFLGGLILNLMPCVFPVLAIKALGLAEAAARGRRAGHALTYTAGVLVAFVALGAALIAARDAGAAAGWGFQFASPAFVAGLAWLLFAIGLNLSGVFRVGGGFEGAGQELAARGGGTGSFFTGLLAVVVATPCTAPFMAAAIAGGLAAPPAAAIGVFLALGLGLAAPYAALATVPGLVRALPRPGRWMEVLRQVLAFPMYGAAAWLVWVLSEEAGPVGVLAAVTGLVLLGFAAWALGAAQAASGRGSRRVGMAAAAAGGVGLVALLATLAGNPLPIGPTAAIGAGAEPFSAGRLAALRAEGRPVFVDMTAAWCVTCLINERLAIDAASVRREFDALRVAYLKGDWTRQDPAITDFLRAHGRDGVPLYVYFPAGGADPVVLPQILTAETVLEELRKG
jgi:thiol:disulfide interchange protein DsbD